jgi:hypothetical protein
VGVAVGGRGLGGGGGAGRVAVGVGGRGVGVAEGAGCESLGVAVSVGAGGLGLGGTLVGDGASEGVDVALGWTVAVGRGVLVARASTTRVFVGVGVTLEPPGWQRTRSRANKANNMPRTKPGQRPPPALAIFFIDRPSAKICPLHPSNPPDYTRKSRRGQRRFPRPAGGRQCGAPPPCFTCVCPIPYRRSLTFS